MDFIADMHIHSRFSRATGKQLNAPFLAAWAAIKGIAVLGTGDITHPVWRAELREALCPDEASGLYRLKNSTGPSGLPPELAGLAPPECLPLFMPQAEISCIYKRGGRARRIHLLAYLPDFDAADRWCRRLAEVGNLGSDGRPILGLDSRHLLEMLLEADERAALIPAHIWTPWFALFGSKSGFDSVEECFGDLAGHIFALETGLSSDPAMNRRWSALDRFRLISNSDAHSGENLGRNAVRFSGLPSYDGIFAALRGKNGSCAFAGTLDMYPEEGKYHLDGHRDCKIVLEPQESRETACICPVCDKPLTIGVLHRVLELADREEPARLDEPGFFSFIPLRELLGEILGVGPKSAGVTRRYAALVERFGSELDILRQTDTAVIRRYWDALGEALERMRSGRVIRRGGYDGEYGVVRVFHEQELRELRVGAKPLLDRGAGKWPGTSRTDTPADTGAARPRRAPDLPAQDGQTPACVLRRQAAQTAQEPAAPAVSPFPEFSPGQRAALEAGPGPVLVTAGPGAGKTRVLVGRLVRLLREGVPASRIAALTFTRRAAGELEERLRAVLGEGVQLPAADTLHALAYAAWRACSDNPPMLLTEEAAVRLFHAANPALSARCAREAWDALSFARERRESPPDHIREAAVRYTAAKAARGAADYTDLPEFWLARLEEGKEPPRLHVLVDEAQDLSPLQAALVRALLPADGRGFFGIGDPDQSIYAFRGAQPDVLGALRTLWPQLIVCRLAESYRAAPAILGAVNALMDERGACGPLRPTRRKPAVLRLFAAPDEQEEARLLAGQVGALLGSASHTLTDRTRRAEPCSTQDYSPGDIAVLVRFKALVPVYKNALERVGIACAAPEREAFFHDPRVALLLAGAERYLGLASSVGREEDDLHCPPALWERGPTAVAVALRDRPPFDPLFPDAAALHALEKLWTPQGGWRGLFTHLSFLRDAEQVRARAEKVRILTLHAAKGLEFRAVFLPALERGIMPFERTRIAGEQFSASGESPEDEELRLLYVGFSRAGEALFLSYAAERRIYGRTLKLPPSPFLERVRTHFKIFAPAAHKRADQCRLPLS